ncbi:MAG: hypothetical protein P8077_06085 [Gammaproteobacteria bacterium]
MVEYEAVMSTVSNSGAGDAGDGVGAAPAVDAPVSTWLTYIEAMHPAEIDLGLDRLDRVARRLGLTPSLVPAQVVTVAGTNGKGSTVAALEALCQSAGITCAAYTSPHLTHFGERLRVNGVETDASAWRPYFARVAWACGLCPDRPCPEGQRMPVSVSVAATAEPSSSFERIDLTFFEFTTLAAFLYLMDQSVACWILEIGLGGRLDAVNWLTPSLSIVTRIAHDHHQWLGADLVAIAREKCGIFRSGVPALWVDAEAPATVDTTVKMAALACAVARLYDAKDFGWCDNDRDHTRCFFGCDASGQTWTCSIPPSIPLSIPSSMEMGDALTNVKRYAQLHPAAWAAALQAMALLFPQALAALPVVQLATVIQETQLLGRFSVCAQPDMEHGTRNWIFDVAHNIDAVNMMVSKLRAARLSSVVSVFAVMADKPWQAMIDAVLPWVSRWVLLDVATERRVAPTVVAQYLRDRGADCVVLLEPESRWFECVTVGCSADDTVLVWGSFFTVGPFLR